jgi:hypothetical protein
MGKRCTCERLFRRLDEDVRLRTLPMAAQHLWLKLMRLALGTDDGVLRLGSDFGFLTALSIAVSHAESETETAWNSLAARGLALLGEDGASILMPDAVEGAERVKAARNNGLRGGRPRKGETPDEAARRRQGSLMLPVAGGLAETQETQRKPPEESSHAASSTFSSERQAAAPGEVSVALGMELAEIAGMDPNGKWTLKPVQVWLSGGATPDQLRDVFTAVASRASYRPPASLAYFNEAVAEARSAAIVTPEASAAEARIASRTAAIAAWQANGCQGPPPSVRAA